MSDFAESLQAASLGAAHQAFNDPEDTKIEPNKFEPSSPVEEVEGAEAKAPIRRRRSTKRRAWGPFARFFLRWLFRRMNG